jgi:hypothetical protein
VKWALTRCNAAITSVAAGRAALSLLGLEGTSAGPGDGVQAQHAAPAAMSDATRADTSS